MSTHASISSPPPPIPIPIPIPQSYSEGLWRPDKQLCRIIKPRGNDLRSMGFAYEGDIHLYPEEALFLVERCKLEIGNLTTPELYEAVDLYHYLTYAYFRQTSLIVFRVDPLCPLPIAFEAYAPSSHFSKKARGDPILYVMYGGTRALVPTDEELVRIFEWAKGVPVKYAIVSDEGAVFAMDLAHKPLENHTHLAAVEAKAQALAAASAATAAAGGGGGTGEDGEGQAGKGRGRKRKQKPKQQGKGEETPEQVDGTEKAAEVDGEPPEGDHGTTGAATERKEGQTNGYHAHKEATEQAPGEEQEMKEEQGEKPPGGEAVG